MIAGRTCTGILNAYLLDLDLNMSLYLTKGNTYFSEMYTLPGIIYLKVDKVWVSQHRFSCVEI